jgi:wobble nucleotide-excising tRNase
VRNELEDILQRTIEQVAQDAEKKLDDHLHRCGLDGRGRSWLEQGLGFVREEPDAPCPFCGQSLEPVKDLIQAYRAVFSEEYRALKGEIEKLAREVTDAFGEAPEARTAEIVATNQERWAFWKKYVGPIGDEVAPPTDWRSVWKTFRKTAVDALDQKSKAPLEPVATDEVRRATALLKDTLRALRNYNEAIAKLNERIERCNQEASTEKLEEAERELDRLKLIKRRHETPLAETCAALVALRDKKDQITKQKKEKTSN